MGRCGTGENLDDADLVRVAVAVVSGGDDSVHLNVDLEIGGSDQLFNMMVGRRMKKDKMIMLLNLVTDKDGKKISKTD